NLTVCFILIPILLSWQTGQTSFFSVSIIFNSLPSLGDGTKCPCITVVLSFFSMVTKKKEKG
ncbi:hypothetical protein, partial [Micromonospora noduli]|uniref:hypothetical protein n=1 Tax=Micromonospora noduli TaxID=709876 RepID=UPI001B863AF6